MEVCLLQRSGLSLQAGVLVCTPDVDLVGTLASDYAIAQNLKRVLAPVHSGRM